VIEAMIRPVAPPLPAPYLRGCPSLDDELIDQLSGHRSVMQPLDDIAQAKIYTLAAEIRFRRESYESEHGVEIVPERPMV
jgi:hypothetical protein